MPELNRTRKIIDVSIRRQDTGEEILHFEEADLFTPPTDLGLGRPDTHSIEKPKITGSFTISTY
jgi:hypothetical protein